MNVARWLSWWLRKLLVRIWTGMDEMAMRPSNMLDFRPRILTPIYVLDQGHGSSWIFFHIIFQTIRAHQTLAAREYQRKKDPLPQNPWMPLFEGYF